MAAKKPTLEQSPAPTNAGDEELLGKCRKRIERAKLDRSYHQARIADCYHYALPWRHKFFQTTPTDQIDDIFDETAMTVLEDFASDMLNVFTPFNNNWCQSVPVQKLDSGDQRILRDQLRAYDEVLFAEMRRSNLYQALQESYLDLGPGTMAMSITDIGISEPIHCEAIPSTELLLDRGLFGRVDGVWREWSKMRGEEIGIKWKNATPPREGAWKPGDLQEYDVEDGVFRVWDTPTKEVWQYVVIVSNRIAYKETYEGSGSNPLITARWSRDSTTAWGVGPTYRVLPAIKALNYMEERFLKLFDKIVDPPTSYEDDGVVNLDQGVTAGMWIPRATGSQAPEVLESKGQIDFGFLKRDDLIHAIKRAHYQDRPDQAGKTPPSATQWADEAAERQRRMGSPATNLVTEWQYGIIKRFAYLLSKRGVLPKVTLNGRDIALQPVSPLLRAQQQEVVVRRDRLAELLTARFGPQIAGVVINVAKYAEAQAKDLGVEDIINQPAEIAQAIQQLGTLLQNANASGLTAPPSPIPA